MSMSVSGAAPWGGGSMMAVSGASARMSPQQKMTNLFNKIDANGSGSITQSQFDQAFQSMNPPAGIKAQGASAIWAQLDPNGTGSVTQSQFVSGMDNVLAAARKGHHHGHGGASATGTVSSATQNLNSLGSGTTTTASGSVNILA